MSSKLEEGQDDRTLYGRPLVDSPRLGIAIVDLVNQTASKDNKYMHYMCMYNQDLEEKDPCTVAHFFVEIDCKYKKKKNFFVETWSLYTNKNIEKL